MGHQWAIKWAICWWQVQKITDGRVVGLTVRLSLREEIIETPAAPVSHTRRGRQVKRPKYLNAYVY